MFYNYVQAPDGVFSRYLNGYDVTYFNENVNCRPKDLTPEQALELGVFPLQIVTPPYHDPLTQALVLADAVLVNGVWTQVYEVVELDPEQRAQAEAAGMLVVELAPTLAEMAAAQHDADALDVTAL